MEQAGGLVSLVSLLDVGSLKLRIDVVPDASSTYDALRAATTAQATSESALSLARLVALSDVIFEFRRHRACNQPGWAKALEALAMEWHPQLVAQLPAALSTLPAVRSVVHLKAGLESLLMAPLRPAPLRGLQLGGKQLARTVAIEGFGLAARLLSVSSTLVVGVDALLTAAAEHAGAPPAPHGAAGAAGAGRDGDSSSSSVTPYAPYLRRAAELADTSAQRLAYASEVASGLSESIATRGRGAGAGGGV